jgi:hypothetical protein
MLLVGASISLWARLKGRSTQSPESFLQKASGWGLFLVALAFVVAMEITRRR